MKFWRAASFLPHWKCLPICPGTKVLFIYLENSHFHIQHNKRIREEAGTIWKLRDTKVLH